MAGVNVEPSARVNDAPSAELSRFAILGAITSALSILAAAVRAKVAAKVIGPEGVGVVAEVGQLVTLATTAATVAAGPVLVAWIAQARRDGRPERLAGGLGSSLALGGALAIVGALAALLAAPFVLPRSWSFSPLPFVALAGAGVVGSTLAGALQSVFIGLSDVRATTWASIISTLLGSTLVVALTILLGLRGQFVALALGGGVAFFTAWAVLSRGRPRIPLRVSWDRTFIRQAFAIGATALVAGYFSQIVLSSIRVVLELKGGAALGALYNGNYQAASIVGNQYYSIVIGGLSNFFWPRYAAAASDEELTAEVHAAGRFIVRVAPPVAFLAIALSKDLIHILYSDRFNLAIAILSFQLAGDITRALSWAYAGPLLYRGKLRGFLIAELAGAALAIGLNALCIWRLGPVGAGVAYTLSYVIYVAIAAWVVRAVCGVRTAWPQLVQAWGFTALAVAFELVSRRVPLLRFLVLPLVAAWLWRSGVLAPLVERLGKLRRRWSLQ
jgi:PST family polysaccharide transporter